MTPPSNVAASKLDGNDYLTKTIRFQFLMAAFAKVNVLFKSANSMTLNVLSIHDHSACYAASQLPRLSYSSPATSHAPSLTTSSLYFLRRAR